MKFIIIAALLATAMAFPAMTDAPKMRHQKTAAVSAVGRSATNIKWTDCDGTGTPYMELTSVTVTGDLKAGGTINVDGKGNNKQSFDVDSVSLLVTVSGVKIYSDTIKLASPQHFNKGVGELKVSKPLPITPPNGGYKITAKIRDQKGNELQCFLVTFTIA